MRFLYHILLLLVVFSAVATDSVLFPRRKPITQATTPFTPSSVAGYYVDYDVDALGLNDGDLISTLTDQSTNAFHAKASGAARPYWTNDASALNGNGFAVFDGGDFLATNFTAITQPTTIFYVGTVIYPDSTKYFFDGYGSSDRNTFFSGLIAYTIYAGSSSTRPRSIFTLNAAYVFELHFGGTNSQILTNGVATGSVMDAGTTSLGGITVGARYSGATPNTNQLARIIVFSGNVTNSNGTWGYGGTGNASNTVYYLKNLYGI